MDIAALAAELAAGHPDTGAYDANNLTAAGQLNAVNRTAPRDTVAGSEILNATDDTEFTALTDAQQSKWLDLCGVDSIDTASGVAKSLEADLFGGGTTTRTNLAAVKAPAASRAVELGLGIVKEGHVIMARE